MCIIVDANCAVDTFSANPKSAFLPVVSAIQSGDATMVLGGTKLRSEYQKLSSVWRFIIALDRAGRARVCSDAAVDNLHAALEKGGMLMSDDPHIIALAQISGARLLCSKDQDLHKDFLGKKFVAKPRGAVYQNEHHAPLLRKFCRHR